MHIGLCCPELSGHLNPMLTLGRELLSRGHQVTLVARPDAEASVFNSNLGFAAVGCDEYPMGSIAAESRTLGRLTAGKALTFTIDMMRRGAEITLRDLPRVIQERGLDALLVDQINPAAGTVAEIQHVPFMKVSNALALNPDPDCPPALVPWRYRPGQLGRLRNRLGNWWLNRITAPIRDAINADRARHGLTPRSIAAVPLHLAEIAQQPTFFDFPRRTPDPRLHFTGPWQRQYFQDIPFPWDRLDGRPLVYASLGTLQNRLTPVFETIAEAVQPLDVQLVISLGAADQDATSMASRLTGNPLVVPVAPQLALLKRATIAITHAGLNTALESLAEGVPMVAMPITNDQPGVARRLEWLGLAEVVLLGQLTVPRLRQAITRVLTEPGYRQRAEQRAAEITAINGLRMAADIVEQGFSTKAPVLRAEEDSSRSVPVPHSEPT